MIRTEITFANPDALTGQLRETVAERIKRATKELWEAVTEAINTPNTGVSVRIPKRLRKPGGPKSKTIYPNPSQPGYPPHKRTGWLQRNTVYDVDEENMAGRVGVQENAPYGAALELGTRRMEARPFLLATAKRIFVRLQQIVTGG